MLPGRVDDTTFADPETFYDEYGEWSGAVRTSASRSGVSRR